MYYDNVAMVMPFQTRAHYEHVRMEIIQFAKHFMKALKEADIQAIFKRMDAWKHDVSSMDIVDQREWVLNVAMLIRLGRIKNDDSNGWELKRTKRKVKV